MSIWRKRLIDCCTIAFLWTICFKSTQSAVWSFKAVVTSRIETSTRFHDPSWYPRANLVMLLTCRNFPGILRLISWILVVMACALVKVTPTICKYIIFWWLHAISFIPFLCRSLVHCCYFTISERCHKILPLFVFLQLSIIQPGACWLEFHKNFQIIPPQKKPKWKWYILFLKIIKFFSAQ